MCILGYSLVPVLSCGNSSPSLAQQIAQHLDVFIDGVFINALTCVWVEVLIQNCSQYSSLPWFSLFTRLSRLSCVCVSSFLIGQELWAETYLSPFVTRSFLEFPMKFLVCLLLFLVGTTAWDE